MKRMHLERSGHVSALLAVALVLVGASVAEAQSARSNVIVPQARGWDVSARAAGEAAAVAQVTQVDVGVVIVEQVATTTMDISLRNPTGRLLNAELVIPVPEGAAVRGLDFDGEGDEPSARLLPHKEAKASYEAIVRKTLDPALMEFVGQAMIRTSVFPIQPNGEQKVRVTYEHLLEADGNRVDYVLPRSESLAYDVPWQVSVKVRGNRAISTLYSPSHQLETTRTGANQVAARIADASVRDPGPFRLSYLLAGEGVTASLLAYPDGEDSGYFLLLAGLPPHPKVDENGSAIKREVTLVLDRSGSMRGEKIEQAKEAALQVLAGLDDGEAFNIIAYDNQVSLFARSPVLKGKETTKKAAAFIEGIKANGGTNLHDALLESVRQKPSEDFLPIVLFLTDGLPTVGQTSEAAIRGVATKSNPYERRVFTFGVGVDVNTPLLDKVALETRATSTFVLPKEDVEVKVGSVFKRLSGPVLASPELEAVSDGSELVRAHEMLPGKLPDLFEGDQLVVLGRYRGDRPIRFELSGNYLGKPRAFKFTFDLGKATTRNAFVPRLWASRKIAVLVEAIRSMGADVGTHIGRQQSREGMDPKLKELVDEIVRLSTEFGVLTEYTAFLAREGTNLNRKDEVMTEAMKNFDSRAIQTRSGAGSYNQEDNNQFMRGQHALNGRNWYVDENLNRVSVSNVQQVNDLAFYRRGEQWVDSRVVARDELTPSVEITFGSPAYFRLVEKLATVGRNGAVALHGDVVLQVDDELIVIHAAEDAMAKTAVEASREADAQMEEAAN